MSCKKKCYVQFTKYLATFSSDQHQKSIKINCCRTSLHTKSRLNIFLKNSWNVLCMIWLRKFVSDKMPNLSYSLRRIFSYVKVTTSYNLDISTLLYHVFLYKSYRNGHSIDRSFDKSLNSSIMELDKVLYCNVFKQRFNINPIKLNKRY